MTEFGSRDCGRTRLSATAAAETHLLRVRRTIPYSSQLFGVVSVCEPRHDRLRPRLPWVPESWAVTQLLRGMSAHSGADGGGA